MSAFNTQMKRSPKTPKPKPLALPNMSAEEALKRAMGAGASPLKKTAGKK